MSKVMRMQQTLSASAADVFHALTDSGALEAWFAEHAAVSLADGRYDFWGRFTPETPSEEGGRHPLEVAEPNKRIRYTWHLRGADTPVDIRLTAKDGATILGIWHHDIPSVPRGQPGCYSMDDVWFLNLENLRRYLAGESAIRCDFTAFDRRRVDHTVEINGPATEIWKALTEPERLERWIASNASVEPKAGGAWNMGWGDEGAFRILEIDPPRRLRLEWDIDGVPTVVTWTLDEQGGKTRLTLVQSGFAPDYSCEGEQAGWLSFLTWLTSMVEFGGDWLPPVKELSKAVALYYAASVWMQQDDILDDDDETWRDE